MKSKIFNSDQIRAIQDGRMTQFMQVVKPQPDLITNVIGGVTWQQSKDKYIWGSDTAELLSDMMQECPFGKIGDVIYCRETLYQNGELGLMYQADQEWIDTDIIPDSFKPVNNYAFCKIPSCQMPPWAARLFLRITNIRVMRVQELTEDDAKAQGYEVIDDEFCPALCALKSDVFEKGLDYFEKYHWTIDFTKTDKP